ncbi:MAG: hypothetical protein IKO65_08945 [Victivallales bacterium]|jgi:acyl carrier protein|nr:hypothetical protein [Victivallales bacterium]
MTPEEFNPKFKAQVFEWLNIESMTPEALSDEEPLFGKESRLGLDSLDAVELVVFIQRTYNIPQKAFEKRKELFVNFKTLADFVRTFPEDQKGR